MRLCLHDPMFSRFCGTVSCDRQTRYAPMSHTRYIYQASIDLTVETAMWPTYNYNLQNTVLLSVRVNHCSVL